MYHKQNIILDFDGTIFRVFANHNLYNLVSKIYNLTKFYNLGFNEQNDAFDIYEIIKESSISNDVKSNLLQQIERWFVEEEIKALDSGILISGFFDFLSRAFENEKNIAIASNNSKVCIEKFFEKFQRKINKDYHITVIGRDGLHPERMKPSTYMLEEICRSNNWIACDTIYIGDHPRDYECALNFGCYFIGMTPTTSKKERLIKYNPTIITVDDFRQLIKLLM